MRVMFILYQRPPEEKELQCIKTKLEIVDRAACNFQLLPLLRSSLGC
jgi:hypothetical protein